MKVLFYNEVSIPLIDLDSFSSHASTLIQGSKGEVQEWFTRDNFRFPD